MTQNDALNDERVQRAMLDRDWTLVDLAFAARLHAYVQAHEDCRQSLAQYDAIRQALQCQMTPSSPAAQAAAGETEPSLTGHAAGRGVGDGPTNDTSVSEPPEAPEPPETPDLGSGADMAEPEGGWRAFKARMAQTAIAGGEPSTSEARAGSRRLWRFTGPLLLAAALALAFSGWALYLTGSDHAAPPRAGHVAEQRTLEEEPEPSEARVAQAPAQPDAAEASEAPAEEASRPGRRSSQGPYQPVAEEDASSQERIIYYRPMDRNARAQPGESPWTPLGSAHGAEGSSRFTIAQQTPAEVSEQVEIFRSVSEAFDRKAAFVGFSGEVSEVGLMADPLQATQDVLLLRLMVVHEGREASQADMTIVPGQTAEMTVPFDGDQRLVYRAATVADDPIGLRLWVRVLPAEAEKDGEPLATLGTRLQVRPGEVISVGHLVTDVGDYELKAAFAQAPVRLGDE